MARNKINYGKMPLDDLMKLAEEGDPKAQLELGDRYFDGKGVERSNEERHKWVKLAAEQGYDVAQYRLGGIYQWCWDFINKAEAIKWYRKAAKQGYAQAEISLGDCYYDGEGVRKNGAMAVKWYTKAAEKGDMWAQNSLGVCYEHGIGVDEDISMAAYWYKLSADQGFEWAQENLNRLYSYVR